MKICTYCGHPNREGFFFCEECGKSLDGTLSTHLPTRLIQDADVSTPQRATWGTARFNPGTSVVLHVENGGEPIIVEPDRRLVLGRADAASAIQPDIDLTPYGALDQGVSRQHATLYRSDDTLILIDMGSSNGTHLNGLRLAPEQPRVVRDGDEIRLGKMVIHVYFRSNGLT